jgi:hypothetical protein
MVIGSALSLFVPRSYLFRGLPFAYFFVDGDVGKAGDRRA